MATITFEQDLVAATATDTQAIARTLAQQVPLGTVLALVGDLGAGKTTFVQGLAEGVGVRHAEDVVSPTYALMHVYEGRVPLIHIDLYRLDSAAALPALGLDEQLLRGDAIVAVEWADRFPESFPHGTIWVTLRDAGDGQRVIRLSRVPASAAAAQG